MESTKLFETKKLPRKRPTRPLWLVLLASAIVPGLGHALVGKLPLGAALFAITGVFGMASGAAFLFEQHHLGWLAGRISTLTALFAAVDATLLAAEQADSRVWKRTDRPRLTAYLNLVGYGIGSLRLGSRVQGLGLIVLGLGVHAWLGRASLPLAVLAELVVGFFAFLGYRLAHENAYQPKVTTEFGELGAAPRYQKPADSTPGWVLPSLAVMCLLVFASTMGAYALQSAIMQAMEVKQDRALAMEPFYRNAEYGISLEMNAPGWTFRAAHADEFVAAQHMAEDTQLQLSVQPRLPLVANDRTAALAALAEATMDGYYLQIVAEGPANVGGREGYRLHARGTRAGRAREVGIFTTGKGWRQYLLWFEWGAGHDEFATSEMAFVLDTLSIENGTPAAIRPQPELAR